MTEGLVRSTDDVTEEQASGRRPNHGEIVTHVRDRWCAGDPHDRRSGNAADDSDQRSSEETVGAGKKPADETCDASDAAGDRESFPG